MLADLEQKQAKIEELEARLITGLPMRVDRDADQHAEQTRKLHEDEKSHLQHAHEMQLGRVCRQYEEQIALLEERLKEAGTEQEQVNALQTCPDL